MLQSGTLPPMTQPVIAVFGSSRSRPGEPDYEQAVRLGTRLAEAGFAVTNGGYAGLMEAVSRGAAAANGSVIGVTVPTLFPDRPGANGFVTTEVSAESLTERIHLMSESAAGSVVLPGSIGTLTELMIVWNDAYIATLRGEAPRPIVAIRSAWEPTILHLTNALDTTSGLVTMVDDVDEVLEEITRHL